MHDIRFRPPDQFGFVTDDLERTAAALGRLWAVTEWRLHVYDQQVLQFGSYRGGLGRFASRNAVAADGRVGVVEPVSGPSVHLDALAANGPGLAYLTWMVDELGGIAARMSEIGVAEAMRGGGHGMDGDGEFVYYDTVATLGVFSQFVVAPVRRRPPSGVLEVGQNTHSGFTGKPVAPGASGIVQQSKNS